MSNPPFNPIIPSFPNPFESEDASGVPGTPPDRWSGAALAIANPPNPSNWRTPARNSNRPVQNPAIVSAPNSANVCKCCFQPGHLYRDCTHPVIDELHRHAINIWVAAETDPQLDSRGRSVPLIRDSFIESIPTFTLRAILWKHKHAALTINLDDHYPSGTFPNIRAWRQREIRSNGIHRNCLPQRIGIYSSAARYDLEEMMWINYNQYAMDKISQSVNLTNQRSSIRNTHDIVNVLNRVRRNLNSSTNVFTQQGLITYTGQLIAYLINMQRRTAMLLGEGEQSSDENRNRLMNHPGIGNWPNDEREALLRAINTPATSLRPQMDDNMLHPYWGGNIDEMSEEIRQQVIGNDPPEDPLSLYRHNPSVVALVENALPQPPDPFEDINISELNSPPEIPQHPRNAGVRQQVIFNINLIQEDENAYEQLPHKACTICWDELSSDNTIATGCNHSFCFECVTTVLQRERQRCPIRIPRNQRFMNFHCAMCRDNVESFHTFSNCEDTQNKLNIIRSKLYKPVNL